MSTEGPWCMHSREGRRRSEGMARLRAWSCLLLAAVMPLAWLPAWAEDKPMRFQDALELFEAKKYVEAYALYELLAKEWDSRAQVVLGSALVHGSLIQRDIPRGVAWLQIAAGESNVSRTTRAQAGDLLLKYEPGLSGAELLRADAIAGEYLAERGRRRADSVRVAYSRLLQPAGAADGVKYGCALDASLPRCGVARADLGNRATVCQAPPTRERWYGNEREGKPLRFEWPEYPERARWYAWEGRVVVAAHVDGSGWICRLTVADGSGIQALDTAALEAVRRWQLAPRRVDGQPTSYLYDVDVTFMLSNYVLN